jgi:hypothetical protein
LTLLPQIGSDLVKPPLRILQRKAQARPLHGAPGRVDVGRLLDPRRKMLQGRADDGSDDEEHLLARKRFSLGRRLTASPCRRLGGPLQIGEQLH